MQSKTPSEAIGGPSPEEMVNIEPEYHALELLKQQPMLPLVMSDGSPIDWNPEATCEFLVDAILLSAAILLIRLPNADGKHLKALHNSEPTKNAQAREDSKASLARCRITVTPTHLILANKSGDLTLENRVPLKSVSKMPPAERVSFDIQLHRLEQLFTEYQRPNGYKIEVDRRRKGFHPTQFDRFSYFENEGILKLEREAKIELQVPVEAAMAAPVLADVFKPSEHRSVQTTPLAVALSRIAIGLNGSDRFAPKPCAYIEPGRCTAGSDELHVVCTSDYLDWPAFKCSMPLVEPLRLALRRFRHNCHARLEAGVLTFGDGDFMCSLPVAEIGAAPFDDLPDPNKSDRTHWSIAKDHIEKSLFRLKALGLGRHNSPIDFGVAAKASDLGNAEPHAWWSEERWKSGLKLVEKRTDPVLCLGYDVDRHGGTFGITFGIIDRLSIGTAGDCMGTIDLGTLLKVIRQLEAYFIQMELKPPLMIIEDRMDEHVCTYTIPYVMKPAN